MNGLQQAALEGEIGLLMEENARLQEQVKYFAEEQDFWRSKYLRDHPEHDTWDYVETARESESGEGESWKRK